MWIHPKEHARLRYAERAIERLASLRSGMPGETQGTLTDVDRVLEPFRIEREKRHADAARIAASMMADRVALSTITGFKSSNSK